MAIPKTPPASESSSSLDARAQSLFEFLRTRFPSIKPEQIASALVELKIETQEETKTFAKRLRRALNQRGIPIKHTWALEAAARVLNGASWHETRQKDFFCTLKVLTLDDIGEKEVPTWMDAGRLMVDACKAWLQTRPSIRALQIQCRQQSLFIIASRMIGSPVNDMDSFPIVAVTPLNQTTPIARDWLRGFSSALELVRRGIEESGVAVLDGFAVAQYCEPAYSWMVHGVQTVTDSALNSELILVRNDNPLAVGFEIARGDELTCWGQLDQDAKDAAGPISIDDEGAWQRGNARYEWQLMTFAPGSSPGDYYPGLEARSLTQTQSEKLLHRYKLAKRVLLGQPLPKKSEIKPLGMFSDAPDTYRVNPDRVARALRDAGSTWEAYCREVGEPGRALTEELPIGFVIALLMHLKPQDPNVLFARPRRDQLVWIGYDKIVRAILPRVNHVRYRASPSVSDELKRDIADAIETLSASILLRHGLFKMEDPLPDLVYTDDGDDLRGALENMGLTAYVGVMPHLMVVPKELKLSADAIPWAIGHSLYVDIDVWDTAARATG
jgi:hypothetical protein